MIDPETRLDGVAVESGNILRYRMTIVSAQMAEFDLERWRQQIVPVIRENQNKNPNTQRLLDSGITIIVQYSSSDGIVFDEIKIEPNQQH